MGRWLLCVGCVCAFVVIAAAGAPASAPEAPRRSRAATPRSRCGLVKLVTCPTLLHAYALRVSLVYVLNVCVVFVKQRLEVLHVQLGERSRVSYHIIL